MTVCDGVVRSTCWRTKTSRSDMPFGCLCVGIFLGWSDAVKRLQVVLCDADFLILGPSGARASCTYTLGQLRRVLVQYGGVPMDRATAYTLHSLKATLLSWTVQLDLKENIRRILGHHRGRHSGDHMVDKYSRDDVVLALLAQLHILSAIKDGWSPMTAQERGGHQPLKELPLPRTPSKLQHCAPGLRPFHRRRRAQQDDTTESGSESDTTYLCVRRHQR